MCMCVCKRETERKEKGYSTKGSDSCNWNIRLHKAASMIQPVTSGSMTISATTVPVTKNLGPWWNDWTSWRCQHRILCKWSVCLSPRERDGEEGEGPEFNYVYILNIWKITGFDSIYLDCFLPLENMCT